MEFYQNLADELKSLFPVEVHSKVLEIGCGDGSLFQYLELSSRQIHGSGFLADSYSNYFVPAIRNSNFAALRDPLFWNLTASTD